MVWCGQMMNNSFTKDDTLVVKGTALLAMMWHHCFYPGRFEKYAVSFWPLTQSQAVNFAVFLKICVSLFAFVSGYGLEISLQKSFGDGGRISGEKVSRWIGGRYVRSFSGYWIIVLLVWLITSVIEGLPAKIYFRKSVWVGLFNMVVDFLGLGQLMGTPMMISTWWYMSAAFAFIVAAPMMFILIHRMGGFFCLAMLAILPRIGGYTYTGGTDFFLFFPVFCIGMVFARYDGFGRIVKWTASGKFRQPAAVALFGCAAVICYKLSYFLPTDQFGDIEYDYFVPVYVVLIFLTVRWLSF